jgi:hypothetical protein
MKQLTLLLAVAVLILAAQGASAQPTAGGAMGSAFSKLFGENTAFSAKMTMRIEPKDGPATTMKIAMAVREGDVRSEIDVASVEGGGIPPEAIEHIKAIGINQTINIVRPAQKVMFIIYPNIKSYVEIPIPPQQSAEMTSVGKVEKTPLGEETVNGHSCVKNKVTVLAASGRAQEFVTWNATDLNDFPIQVQSVQDGTTTTSLFAEVDLSKPDSSQFDVPQGYTLYKSLQELMDATMRKMMGGQKEPSR